MVEDEGFSFAIKESNMDGSALRNLVIEDEIVQSLTLDPELHRLYFIKNYRKIFYYDFNTNLTSLVNTFYGEDDRYSNIYINSLALYKENIYFGENYTSSIMYCSKNTCRNPEVFRNNTNNLRQLKVLSFSDAHLNQLNGCSAQLKQEGKGIRKNCQHLCLPLVNDEHVCHCSLGYKKDRRSSHKCYGFDDFIIYSLGYELRGVAITDPAEEDLMPPLQRFREINSVDFDAKNDYLYLSDNEKGEILRIKKDGSQRHILLNSNENFEQFQGDWLGGIALDWIAENLYWTDQKRGLIEVSRLDGFSNTTML